jgi:ATP-dependent RNA helicase RhlE
MKFDDYYIDQGIKRSLDNLGFKKPTDIQYRSIPAILKGEDVLAIAQTGTGKTGAFAIPIISTIEARKRPDRPDGVKCIVMAPTHELALQITDVFVELSRYTRVTVLCIHGGVDQEPQISGLNKGVDVLIATPGRLFDLVSQGHLRLHRVEILVLDEADHMLDLGFIKDIRDLTGKLPKKRQTLFFSATINDHIKDLAYSLVTNPIRIQVSPKDPVSKNITHSVAFIAMDDKRYFLERVVTENPESKILVFVRTKVRAERVFKAMERVNIATVTIHSDKDQNERAEAMRLFRSGEVKILVATDVSARGIDIPDVDYVVNYDLPDKPENYVHRVGRTGRGMKKGLAVSFSSPEEQEMLDTIEEFLGQPINRVHMDKADYTQTIDFSSEHDWRTLIAKEEEFQSKQKKKKGKK